MIVTSPINELRNWTRAQAEAVSKGWWVLLLSGLLSVVAGGIIFSIDWTVDDLVVFVGTLLVIRGALTMSSIPVDGSLRTGSIVLGVLEIFVGIGVFVWPVPRCSSWRSRSDGCCCSAASWPSSGRSATASTCLSGGWYWWPASSRPW